MTTPVRYIRDTINRYKVDGIEHPENCFLEIQARDANNVNVALNKAVTLNFVSDQFTESGRIVDGEFGNTNATVGTSTVSPASVTVDLGAVFDIANLTFWHYYGNPRMYHGVVHEISTDGATWTVIFDSDVNGEYIEGGGGHVMTAPLNAIVSPFPSGAMTSQPPPDGQTVTITFSTTNTPTSGMASLNPAATNPNGAISTLGTIAFGTNTGTATFTNVPAGNYAPTITLTNAAGTRSVSGLQPVSIIGISASPEAPSGAVPTVTSFSVSPTSASGATQFTWLVQGTNNPSQDVAITTPLGSVDSLGRFIPPPATSAVQNFNITFISAQDNSFRVLVPVTIAASIAPPSGGGTAPAPTARRISKVLTTDGVVPYPNTANIKGAWFDQPTPNLFGPPVHTSNTLAIINGRLDWDLPSTTLPLDGIGCLVITLGNGLADQQPEPPIWFGPVKVL